MWVRTIAALLCILAGQGAAQQITVIDGDTFDLDETRIRLLNIDAPEMGQECHDAGGREFACGARSADALKALLGAGRVRCTGDDKDRFGRWLAKCTVHGQDVGAMMVAEGHALAFVRYSDEYVPQQLDAYKAGRGVWAGEFELPWDFRKARWQQASVTGPRRGCPIKGNISAGGERIYHTPYSRYYDKTHVNPVRGERWFCDEAEAISAGWRAPRG